MANPFFQIMLITVVLINPQTSVGHILLKRHALLEALAQKKRLAIGFNRQANGGFDTTLPLQINTNSNLASTLDFGDCMLTLFDRAKANPPNR